MDEQKMRLGENGQIVLPEINDDLSVSIGNRLGTLTEIVNARSPDGEEAEFVKTLGMFSQLLLVKDRLAGFVELEKSRSRPTIKEESEAASHKPHQEQVPMNTDLLFSLADELFGIKAGPSVAKGRRRIIDRLEEVP